MFIFLFNQTIYNIIMKQLIRKILKEESLKQENLKQTLKQSVKEDGWEFAADLVNGPEDLAKLAFNDNPMEFIDSLGLRRHYGRTSIYFSNNEGRPFLDIPFSLKVVEVDYELSRFLFNGFKLSPNGAKRVLKDWLFDRHGIEIKTLFGIYV
jgi:hypothetical protein